jgi:hypothetical protein
MARKGYQLDSVSFGYKFIKSKPKDDIIRIDYRTFKKEDDFIDYVTMFEDSGWKHIYGNRNTGNQYFKKESGDENDDIFSDQSSKAGRYKRLSEFSLSIIVVYIPILIALINSGAINARAMLKPKLLYYTPGLWELSGLEFWRKFLFETPFALMRGFAWLFILFVILIYIIFIIKAKCFIGKVKGKIILYKSIIRVMLHEPNRVSRSSLYWV